MRNKRKPLWMTMSVVFVLALTVAGCSGGGNKTAESTEKQGTTEQTTEPKVEGNTEAKTAGWQLGSEPLDFTFYGNYDWYKMPEWGKDKTTAWIKENKKVNIKAISSGGGTAAKLNTMMASNELPDVIWGERQPDVERLIEADMLVPIDQYMDKYPNLKKWLDPKAANMLRSSDGKLYIFPNWYTTRANGTAGWVVNKKIYNELGSPKLETFDDLYAYLKQVKEKYPKIIPYETGLAKDGQGVDMIYQGYKENNPSYQSFYAVPQGDQLTSIYKDPDFREARQFIAKLFREKLATQDAFTQTADQVKEKVVSGRVAVYASSNPTVDAMQGDAELKKTDPDAGYIMIWPLHKEGLDKNKIFAGNYKQLGWNGAVITKNAKDPEKIFAFLDWYTGPEGSALQMWGPPGPDGYWNGFDADGETPKYTDKYSSDSAGLGELQSKNDPFMWVGNTVYIDDNKAKFEATLPMEKRNWSTHYQYEITWKTQKDATEFVNLFPVPDSQEGEIRTRITDIYLEQLSKAAFAKSDQEVLDILDKAHEDSVAAGYQQYLDYITKRWHENLGKMAGK
ncbi:ABC transporter substrate-binding protein [Paenibacillus selenitireducens]|uniref:ABC transporter substrate-binding protein n=1 Tax=Paenibacillus selenitireducens TaxID=1324314 RepID=A0A1T2XHZ7_9BACL|nr:extracellular solute-binding protein [Paenibacillus selenitireducens]OPA79511.1 ABC transporter substrate-binding protein [Paenibacillus selenitireducens]